MGLLYDAVAAGMCAYGHAAFRVTTLGPSRFRFAPGTLVLVTHRAETDVPLVCPPLYRRAGLWRYRRPRERMTFAARDDLFLPGFFAGFPRALEPRTRARLFPYGVGRWLPLVQVHPIRSASTARLGEALRLRRGDSLTEILGDDEIATFRARAGALGLPPPVRVADVFRGEYADLLWRSVPRGDAAATEAFWSTRAARAARDFRFFVDVLRGGGVLVVFPEGRPSPDGAIGPLERGLAGLVRRGRPRVVRPVALAYDPLVRGRTRVTISIGADAKPPEGDVEEAALALLRRALPLTAGQIAAAGADADTALAEAGATRRPVEPDLLDADRRARRLEEARAVAAERPDVARFLAREFASSRAR